MWPQTWTQRFQWRVRVSMHLNTPYACGATPTRHPGRRSIVLGAKEKEKSAFFVQFLAPTLPSAMVAAQGRKGSRAVHQGRRPPASRAARRATWFGAIQDPKLSQSSWQHFYFRPFAHLSGFAWAHGAWSVRRRTFSHAIHYGVLLALHPSYSMGFTSSLGLHS